MTPLFGCFHGNFVPGKMPKYYYNHLEERTNSEWPSHWVCVISDAHVLSGPPKVLCMTMCLCPCPNAPVCVHSQEQSVWGSDNAGGSRVPSVNVTPPSPLTYTRTCTQTRSASHCPAASFTHLCFQTLTVKNSHLVAAKQTMGSTHRRSWAHGLTPHPLPPMSICEPSD